MEGIKEAIQYLVGLGKDTVQVIKAENGGQYTTNNLKRIEEVTAETLEVHTLTAIVDYIKSNIDKLGEIIVQVKSPTYVLVKSALNSDRARECYISAKALLPDNIRFDNFMAPDKFNIMLQSSFVDKVFGEEQLNYKKMLLQVSGCVKEEAVKQVGDDGITQSAVIKTGVASVGEVKVPNPVQLAPFRTFQEIDQPTSSFIFRMESGPKCALFEADGGAWKNEAMQNIKQYLAQNLEGVAGVHILA